MGRSFISFWPRPTNEGFLSRRLRLLKALGCRVAHGTHAPMGVLMLAVLLRSPPNRSDGSFGICRFSIVNIGLFLGLLKLGRFLRRRVGNQGFQRII